MKKLLYLFTIMLVVACSSDDSNPVTPINNDDTIDLYATGTVSEQTPAEAKQIIFGKWSFSSSSRLMASGCTFNSIEFTEDSYIMFITIDGEVESAFGSYDINAGADGNVSSVELNYELDNSVITIATLTDVVVTETNTEIFATFLIEWNLPEDVIGCDNLEGEYSAEKEDPMDESDPDDSDSNHTTFVGNWTFVSIVENDIDISADSLNEPCYESSDDDDEDGEFIEGCTPATSLNLTISTYGTYALVWTGSNEGTFVEADTWSWTDETQTAFTVGSEENNLTIEIQTLTDTEAILTTVETGEWSPYEVYNTVYTFRKN